MAQDAFETETLAHLYLEQGHPEKAMPIYQRLHQEAPSNVSVSEGLARCQDLLASRSKDASMSQGKRIAILERMLAALKGEMPVKPRQDLGSVRTVLSAPVPSPRERRLALLQKLMNRLTARET